MIKSIEDIDEYERVLRYHMSMNSNNIFLDPLKVDFFYDFLLFLKHLEKQSIKRTATGMISLSAIKSLLTEFKERETIKEFQEYGWKLRREEELDFLEQIKIISEVMFAIYKRKGFYYLSKNGRAFLQNLKPTDQYKEMVLHFWYRVNWGYFYRGREVNGLNLSEKLQKHQNSIWKALFSKGTEWIDYKLFCKTLSDYLHLDEYFISYYDLNRKEEPNLNYPLFYRNLVRFGCVELEEKRGKSKYDNEIVRFHSTSLGLYVYNKALFQNYL